MNSLPTTHGAKSKVHHHYRWWAAFIRSHPRQLLAISLTLLLLGATVIHQEPPKKFRGKQYWKEGVTQSVQTLWESEFARFQMHRVEMGTSTIPDWLWYDESDNVNVLVQEEGGDFLVLKQTKYAIQGETLAVIGGLIEPEEEPLKAAQRELEEELKMTATKWKSLGNFVAAANRGGGTTHVFWAQNAKPIKSTTKSSNNDIAFGELERQDMVRLSRTQLVEELLKGRFREIKWTATVALALLSSLS